MLHGLTRRFDYGSRFFGLILAVLALVGQISVGSVVPAQSVAAEQENALEAALVLCHSDNGSAPSHPTPLHHHMCALCPLCHVPAQHSVVLTASLFLPIPSTGMTTRVRGIAAARAPPTPILVSAYPRGPPSLA
jgi:hypothetical protein